jgi:8-oxo-dGTP diphosphatase
MLTKDSLGNMLLDLIQGPESKLHMDINFKPLTHALVLARSNSKFLLVYNRFQAAWELPGGMIDPGEQPGETALRELTEESNQTLSEMSFHSLMKLELMPDHRQEFGSLYCGQVTQVRPFEKNDESTGIVWWDRVVGSCGGYREYLRN